LLDRGHMPSAVVFETGVGAAVERQLAKPDALTSAGVPSTYAPHWFRTESTFDDAERLVRMTTGADVTELYGSRDTDTNPLTTANGQSVIKMTYSVRGFIKTVGGSYGSILASASNDEVGLPLTQKYGDPAGTTSSAHYDAMNRLANITLSRQAPAFWSQVVGGYTPPTGGPSNLQTVLENTTYHYDLAGNPTQIDDGRDPSLWPAGAKPTSKTITYDDFYRVTHISYRNNNDSYVSPNAHEVNAGDHKIPAFKQANFAQRVQEQGFSFDWLGNTTSATDDTNSAFFDRSIGGINNGGAGGVAGPHQLGNAVGQDGNVAVTYDAAGNLATMNVAKVCAGGGLALLALAPKALSASVRTSSPSTSIVRPPPPPPPPPPPTFCVTKFAYEWDEVGQLARARRWDPGSGVADYDFSYVYDGNGARTVTAATDSVRPTERQYRADVFQTLRLDGAAWDATSGDYTRTAITEAVYFGAGGSVARLKYASEALPSQSRAHLHVFLEFSDKLGSTGSVVDLETSELVEAGTYLPFGDAETDYRTDRWSSFREEERFVGKVEDREVGLTYFGGRYYSATLGRWMSADPIAVHQAAGDLNPYAYVAGRLSTLADPSGLGPQDDEVPDPKTGVVSGYVEGVGYCMGKECLAPQFANATFDFTTLYDAAAAGNSTTAVSAPHPPPMAPVTSVADTNAEEGATLETLKTGAAGLLFGMGQGGTPGGMLTTAVNLPDGPRNNATFRYWQGAGQIIGGVISVVNGAGAVTGGAGVSTTGVLAPGGVAIAGYGILSIVNGVTSIGLGIALMAENAGAAGGPKAYQRPSNATNDAQRASVQGQPCATCGNTAPRMNADHVQPLVEEFYQNEGQIDLERMKSVEAVQPQCPTCSNRQGGFLAGFARAMKKLFGL
jgi:RHS repeat-associated protein